MAEAKTKQNEQSVEEFLNTVKDEKRRQDSFAVLNLMKKITGEEPKMWGASIVGFGNYKYKYESGREGEWALVAFSPRKQNLTIYLATDFTGHEGLLDKLGKHKTGKVCLYINKLEDVDLNVLEELIKGSIENVKSGGVKL